MTRTLYLLILLFVFSDSLSSEELYVKASTSFNVSTNNQTMPQYFIFRNVMPDAYGGSIGFVSSDFNLASGFSYQGTIGYAINDIISVELGISSFTNINKEYSVEPSVFNDTKSLWNFHQLSFLPTILFGKDFGKSRVNIFASAGIGISSINIKASIREFLYKEYEFEKSTAFSWGYGIEHAYSVSENFSIFSQLGINNSYTTPKSATLLDASEDMEYLSTYEKEIVYVDEIRNIKVDPYDQPEMRLSETLQLNSIYLGVGIKYLIKK